MQSKYHHNSGFTLIELVIVIVILGILSATAVPKFVDLASDARLSVLEGMEGAISTGVTLIHAKAVINQKTAINTTDTIEVLGSTVSVNSGYPSANLNGIGNVITFEFESFTSDECTDEWCAFGNQIANPPDGVTMTTESRFARIFQEGYTHTDQCSVYYVNHRDGTSPIIGIESSGCE